MFTLKLTDAAVATKIFERLNFRGVKVGVVDLVRNEVFSRMSQSPQESLNIYETVWRPFEARFENREDGFFFPYSLIHNPLIKKSELFSELRKIWKGLSPTEIITHMEPFQKQYLSIVLGNPSTNSFKLNLQIKRLHKIRIPSATFPFVIQVLNEIDNENLSLKKGLKLLELLESFLVRRIVLGYEPTGLHALFKGVWDEIKDNPTRENLKSKIFGRSTIQYPTNKEIENAVLTRPIYKSKICSFILREYDKSLPGDTPEDEFTIEHVLPNTWVDGDYWSTIFSKEEHRDLKDTLPNLIPLSKPLNQSVQRDRYSKKKPKYLKESMYVSSRVFAESWNEWNEANMKLRAKKMANWINKRWKE